MYSDDHNPPHCHARHGEFRAMVDIVSGDLIEGKLPKRSLRLIQAWIEIHREELMANWLQGQSENPDFMPIEPLK